MSVHVCYVVLSHTKPRQVARLVHRLLDDDPACHVALHHDAASSSIRGLGVDHHPRVSLLSFVQGAVWGGFGIVEATQRALFEMADRIDPDWFVVISGQDYPLAHGLTVRDRLLAADADAYVDRGIEVPPDRPAAWADRWHHARYYYRFIRLAPRRWSPPARRVRHAVGYRLTMLQPFLFVYPLPHGGIMLGLRWPTHPFGDAPCRVGSQWFAVSRRGVRVLRDAEGDRRALARHMRWSVLPDEAYFTTFFHARDDLRVADHNLTFAEFPPESSHPKLLTLADLDELVACDRAFARKLDEDHDPALFDALDARAAHASS